MDINKEDLLRELSLLSVYEYTMPTEDKLLYSVTERLVDLEHEISGNAYLRQGNIIAELHAHFVQGCRRKVESLSSSWRKRLTFKDEIKKAERHASLCEDEFVSKYVNLSSLPNTLSVPVLLPREKELYVLTCQSPLRQMTLQLSPVKIYRVEVEDVDFARGEILLSYETNHGRLTPLCLDGEGGEITTSSLNRRWFICADGARKVAGTLLRERGLSDSTLDDCD